MSNGDPGNVLRGDARPHEERESTCRGSSHHVVWIRHRGPGYSKPLGDHNEERVNAWERTQKKVKLQAQRGGGGGAGGAGGAGGGGGGGGGAWRHHASARQHQRVYKDEER
ncbi:hypothetical protein EYF80_055649 [Liparis tanakae]|uniref:Uncharacterized protein n=1 Tax=Liparis tanakae TaxID=230148 RepID=A0A4Z2F0K8_9TELE|nr:hypothetical protein EYF80_055649 [Liparis tanakae]